MQVTLNIEDKNFEQLLLEKSKSIGISINEFILKTLKKEIENEDVVKFEELIKKSNNKIQVTNELAIDTNGLISDIS